MNKNLLIVLAFLLFNIGYGQGGTINTSAPVLASINTVYGTASNSDSFLVSGINIDQRIEVTPPLGFEVSRNGTIFTDTVLINTPTGGRGDIGPTLIYIRLKGTIPANVYGGMYFSLTSPDADDLEVFMSPSTVNKGALTILADNKSKMYGNSNPDLTASYSGFVLGDNINSLTTPIKIQTIADETSGAGIYNITVTGGESPNYIIYGYPGKLTIGKAPLTITTNDASKVYGSLNPTFTTTYFGFVNGDNETKLTTKPTFATSADTASPVGKYEITASGAVSSNYNISYGTTKGFLDVTPAKLSITTNDGSKVYGSLNPDFTATYFGFVNGDNETKLTTKPTITTIADTSSPVGKYEITAAGAVSPNYEISYGTPNGFLTVTPAKLTINTNDTSKVYGSSNPDFTATYVGFVNGDNETKLTTKPTITTIADTSSPVGKYEITAAGTVSPNYEISYGTPNGFLTVTPAKLTITTNDNSKVYGSLNPTFTTTYVGFVNGDNETKLTTKPTIATSADTTSPVGKYEIIASGAVSPNYEIVYGNPNGFLTITPAKLTITTNDASKVYGSSNPDFTATFVGFVNGDNETKLTTKPTITTIADTSSPVGKYAITAIGAVSSNYEITYDNKGFLTVTPAALTITTIDNSKVYGSVNPVLAVSYDGFVSGESEANLTTKPIISTVAVTVSVIGKYAITAIGAVSSNYEITYNNKGILNVTPAALTITTIDNSKVYGSVNPVLAVSYDGFVSAESEANLTTKPTISTVAITGSAVGKYAITAIGAVSSNYEITYNNKGILNVTPAALTIKADDKKKERGMDNPVLTLSYVGFVPGETEADLTTKPTIATVAVKESPAGEYDIIVSGATSSNYTITFEKGILTVTKSSNADLSNIVISDGSLDKPFDTDAKGYKVEVPYEINSYVINPIPVDPNATVEMKIDGKVIDPTAPFDLKVGDNVVTIVVTAEDGVTQETYTVVVTREAAPLSNDSGLTDLAISKGTLSPAFAEGTTAYTDTVPNDVAGITVTPITSDPTATITVNGKPVPSGTASENLPLEVGENEIKTVVTAQDGTITTYIVVVTREAASLSNDSGLTDLAISKGTLSPAFAEGTTAYTDTVPNDVAGITVTPITADPTATITVNGKPVPSGTASANLPLEVGENEIKTVVTAQDGTITTYTVIVTREAAPAPDNAGLSDIALSDGALSPAFNTDTKGYEVDVPNETNSIVITPKTIDPDATVVMTIDGKVIDPTSPIDLKVGDNAVTIVVTAPDGTTDTYIVIVNRADAVLQPIVPTNIITPNGDGKNDNWIVPGLDQYPNNSVKVFDRAARLVYSKNNYNNEWDGTYKGSPLNEDTYYYLIDLGNGSPKLKGFITIIRDNN
ncbi:MBG domain-containing protein [Flavobacterium sp. 9]|uniref:MBG domain-containing protein n=1 Tax=Flavobacterium sp. 9 TaxID=2035198 RepID=UPI001304588B|nr:MBG domain-containing protein [Flavobacterium sp. 9]